MGKIVKTNTEIKIDICSICMSPTLQRHKLLQGIKINNTSTGKHMQLIEEEEEVYEMPNIKM